MTVAYVLSEGNTASTDYFLFPYLQSTGYRPQLVDTRQSPNKFNRPATPGLIVLSRYLPLPWHDLIEEYRLAGCRIVYFMDDDLFDIKALTGLPWRYRWKILRLALGQQRRLKSLCKEFWVSTPYLANKYSNLSPRLIQASPSPKLIDSTPPLVRICYHATASHRAELHWLVDVVRKVQSAATNTHFELFGDTRTKRLFSGIPRVSILHPMSWSQYLSWSSVVQRDIALAPLLPNAFNSARGPTKFFDYARVGAAGIYSSVPPYLGFIQEGVDGLLVENDPELWGQTIINLASDTIKRTNIAVTARKRALGIAGADDSLSDAVSLPSI